jgi:GTPase SAR1 family protein
MSDIYIIRLIIVGETGVGKTSLLIRFNEDNFILDQKTTIGVDYKAKEVVIGDDTVKLQASYGFVSYFHF